MSSFDAIPPAVATLVSAYCNQVGRPRDAAGTDELEKRMLDLTDKLTRTFTKALADGAAGKY